MKLHYLELTGTTESDGSLTINAPGLIIGQLEAVEWIVGTFATGVDATLSEQSRYGGVARTLLTLTNADANAVYYPRYVVHSEAGAALTGTSGGDRTKAFLFGIPRLVVAEGGSGKTGSMILYYWSD